MNVNRRLLLTLVAGCALNGKSDQSCGIEGFVTSDAVAAVPGARVGIDSVTKGLHRESSTNINGHYSFEELPPGAYSIWAEIKDLGCLVYPHISLFPGRRVRQDFHFAKANRNSNSCSS
jgi:hypothetical protein